MFGRSKMPMKTFFRLCSRPNAITFDTKSIFYHFLFSHNSLLRIKHKNDDSYQQKKGKIHQKYFLSSTPSKYSRHTLTQSLFFMTNRLVIVMASCFILYLILLALLPSYLGAVFVLAVSYQRKKMEPKPMPMAQ